MAFKLNHDESEAPRATLTVVPITIGGGKQALKDAARSYTGEALGVVIAAMQSGELPVGQRISAAQEILNRGWGKPGSEVTLSEETLAVLAPIMVPKKNAPAVLEGVLVGRQEHAPAGPEQPLAAPPER